MRFNARRIHRITLWVLVICVVFCLSPGTDAFALETQSISPEYPCYQSQSEIYASGLQLEAQYPQLARWVDYGDSWKKAQSSGLEGFDLRVLELTNLATPGPKPSLVVVSGLSANELAPVELNLRLAEEMLAGYGGDPNITWVLDKLAVRLVWVTNPDGRERAEEQARASLPVTWSKNLNPAGCTEDSLSGVSLNRNFAYAWNNSPTDGCHPDFPGLTAQSEPETLALQAYLSQVFSQPEEGGMLINLRTRGNYLVLPWRSTTDLTGEHALLDVLAKKLGVETPFAANHSSYVTQPAVGTSSGALVDYAYSQFGIASYELWLGPSQSIGTEMSCESFESQYLQPSLRMLEKSARLSLAPGENALGPEVVGLTLTQPNPAIDEWQVQGEVSSAQYRDYITRGTPYRISVSVDGIPWVENPEPMTVTLTPDALLPDSLASFDFALQTAGLTPGQHTLFISPEGMQPNGTVSIGILEAGFIQVNNRTYLPLIRH